MLTVLGDRRFSSERDFGLILKCFKLSTICIFSPSHSRLWGKTQGNQVKIECSTTFSMIIKCMKLRQIQCSDVKSLDLVHIPTLYPSYCCWMRQTCTAESVSWEAPWRPPPPPRTGTAGASTRRPSSPRPPSPSALTLASDCSHPHWVCHRHKWVEYWNCNQGIIFITENRMSHREYLQNFTTNLKRCH